MVILLTLESPALHDRRVQHPDHEAVDDEQALGEQRPLQGVAEGAVVRVASRSIVFITMLRMESSALE